jgi:hypothetical protein
MIQELERIVLTADLPEYHLKAGDIGTVVLIHGEHQGYEVEFVTLDGETVAVTSVLPAQIRPFRTGEIAHVRALESV